MINGLKDLADAGKMVKNAANQIDDLTKGMRNEIKSTVESLDLHNVYDNKILRHSWDEALKKTKDIPRFSKYWKTGKLELPSSMSKAAKKELMKDMYKTTRTEFTAQVRFTIKEVESQAKELRGIIKELPEKIELHHWMYQAKYPELAVEAKNLTLAMRDLHEALHGSVRVRTRRSSPRSSHRSAK